jgi:Icc-related predicted phosphoesterase
MPVAVKKKILTVTDLHCNRRLYELLTAAVQRHEPDVVAVVGDFLDATGETEGKLNVEECARVLSQLPCPETVFIRGNHESAAAWWQFASAWEHSGRKLHLLEGACFCDGPLVLVGFPCLMNYGDAIGPDFPEDPDLWLPGVLQPHLPAARTLWLMHEPPSGTILSQLRGPLSGRIEWRQAIGRFSPRLVIFGHDHRTPIEKRQWHCRIDHETLCINVGQNDQGPLNYVVVDMLFPKSTPCLPRLFQVSGYLSASRSRVS